MADNQLVQELKSVTNIYIGLSNAERELSVLKIEHKNHPLFPQELQQRVAAIGRKLEECLGIYKADFVDDSEPRRLVQAMINSIQSFQRYTVKKMYPGS